MRIHFFTAPFCFRFTAPHSLTIMRIESIIFPEVLSMKKRTLLLSLAALLAATTISANDSLPFTAAVKENGMWGAVNGAGQVVIPISYDRLGLSLSEADEQEEDLLSEEGRDELIEAEKGGLRGFFTRTGKEVIPISYESRSIWKEGALAVRGKDKKISFYKKDGSLISGAAYDQVSDFENGMAIVKQGATYGYLSLDGKEVKPVYQEARFFEDGLAAVKEKGRWGVIDMTGRYIVSPIYKDTGAAFQEGRLAVKNQKNLWGYIDREGKEIIPPAYKAVSPAFSEGYAAIRDDSKLWGFIDTEGNVTAKPQFKAVLTPFSEGLSGVKTIDGNGYARPDGTIAFMADYDQLFPFRDGLAEVREGEVETHAVRSLPPISIGIGWGWGDWLAFRHHHHPWGWGWGIGLPIWYPGRYDDEPVTSVTEKRGYIDKNGKVIASPANDRVFSAGRKGILLAKDGRYGWVDREGTYIAHTIYTGLLPDEEDGVLLAKDENKKWGLLSMEDGHELLPFSYKEIRSLGSGLFGYKEEGKWGIADKDGTRLTAPLYLAVSKAGEGLLPVKTKNGWRFLTPAGHEAFPHNDTFSDVTPFSSGLAGVKVKGKWGLIDKTGRYVMRPAYEDLDIL